MALESANQSIRWKERIGIMVLGHTFIRVEEFLVDYTAYPAVIAWLGSVTGGLVMTTVSALGCYLIILFYDWTKKDWLGLELLKKVRDGEDIPGRFAGFVQRIARKGDWLAFLLLSCYTDPFMTTVYLRHGTETYNGLSSRDWKIFWGSVLVANLWWTIVMTMVVASIRYFIALLGLA